MYSSEGGAPPPPPPLLDLGESDSDYSDGEVVLEIGESNMDDLITYPLRRLPSGEEITWGSTNAVLVAGKKGKEGEDEMKKTSRGRTEEEGRELKKREEEVNRREEELKKEAMKKEQVQEEEVLEKKEQEQHEEVLEKKEQEQHEEVLEKKEQEQHEEVLEKKEQEYAIKPQEEEDEDNNGTTTPPLQAVPEDDNMSVVSDFSVNKHRLSWYFSHPKKEKKAKKPSIGPSDEVLAARAKKRVKKRSKGNRVSFD